MQNISKGLLAGFAATVVLSAMLIAKGMMGMPLFFGWAAHFMIGTLAWGGGFALLYDHVPGGTAVTKGLAWGVGAWLAMMLFVMPMAGAGLFGLAMGIMGPMMTLIMHLVFGAVLGFVFASLALGETQAA